jgi:hypothetical protein
VSKKTDGKAASTMAKRRIKSMNTVKWKACYGCSPRLDEEMKSLLADAKEHFETQDIKRQENFIPFQNQCMWLIKSG